MNWVNDRAGQYLERLNFRARCLPQGSERACACVPVAPIYALNTLFSSPFHLSPPLALCLPLLCLPLLSFAFVGCFFSTETAAACGPTYTTHTRLHLVFSFIFYDLSPSFSPPPPPISMSLRTFSYLLQGNARLVGVQSESGRMEARAVLRLLLRQDNMAPVLFMDSVYYASNQDSSLEGQV